MTVDKELAPPARTVPEPIVFGDEPEEALTAFAEFAEGEITATHERPEGWASTAARRLRSLSSEAPEE